MQPTPEAPNSSSILRYIFAHTNRGMLLDIFVFLMNIFLMRWLSKLFIRIFQQSSEGDAFAQFTIFVYCLAIYILPALGAYLNRWHFQQRLQLKGKSSPVGESFLGGCLFNPLFYFCLNLVIFSAINAFVFQFIYGNHPGDDEAVPFVSSIFFGLVLTIFQTIIIYRYFLRPKEAPKSRFLLGPRSELIGDICIFLNMVLFQIAWNMITTVPFGRVSNVTDFFGRLFFLSFIALLIYFPPRIFYLAEDIKRPWTWLTILLANSPVILRIIFGSD